jgi:hypothetical protein
MRRVERGKTLSGVSEAFLVGCHIAAMRGKRAARELVTDSRLLVQNGQALPRLAR